MLAAVRVRGVPDTPETVSHTLTSLNLDSRHSCVLLEDSASVRGMLDQARDYIAFGAVSDDTARTLIERRSDGGDMDIDDIMDAGISSPFHLSPPSNGFSDPRRGYGQGGSLGERDDMDRLLERMM